MSKSEHELIHTAVVLDEDTTLFTLQQLCQHCDISAEYIIELVEIGALEPHGHEPFEWQFTIEGLRRTETALRLQDDLGVNLAGAALVLELLEELHELRSRVEILEFHVQGK